MLDEHDVRGAVRSVLDQPAPAPATSLDLVVRRGRRRALVRRAGALGGVVAAVVVIGIGATALRGLPSGETGQVAPATEPPGPIGSEPATSSASPDWPPGWEPVPIAPQTDKWTPPPAAPTPPLPLDPGVDRDEWGCTSGVVTLPPPTATIRPEREVVPAFVAAVNKVTAPAQVRQVEPATWTMRDPKVNDQRGFVAVDVTDAAGTGSVQLEVYRFGGTALQNADADAYSYGNCVRPVRKTLPDGTILQMYPVIGAGSPMPIRYVRVFTPGGRVYVAGAAGYGSIHTRFDENGTGRVEGGRGSVPLTTPQLAQLAEELAKLG